MLFYLVCALTGNDLQPWQRAAYIHLCANISSTKVSEQHPREEDEGSVGGRAMQLHVTGLSYGRA